MAVRGKRADASVPPRQGEEPNDGGEPIPTADGATDPKDNQKPFKPSDLTEAQRIALTHNWAGKVKNQQAILAAAEEVARSEKGKLRNLFKQVKAELGDEGKEDVENQIKIRTDNGAEEMQAKILKLAQALRWGNVGIGSQVAMVFEDFVDIRPDDEVAFNEGKLASYRGDMRQPPAGYLPGTNKYQKWLEGYQFGQDDLMKGFKPLDGLPAESPPPPPAEEPPPPPQTDDCDPIAEQRVDAADFEAVSDKVH